MQKLDGISTNVLIIFSELTLNSDTCGLCFRRIVETEEADPVSMPYVDNPLPRFGTVSSWPTRYGPQRANSQRRREADDFDFSGFKRIQIVSKVSNPMIKEICEMVRSYIEVLSQLYNLQCVSNYVSEHRKDLETTIEVRLQSLSNHQQQMLLDSLKASPGNPLLLFSRTLIANCWQSLTICQHEMFLDTLKVSAKNEVPLCRELVFDESFTWSSHERRVVDFLMGHGSRMRTTGTEF
jgi:hypothetical protein